MPPSSSPFGRGTLSIFPFLAEDEFEGACRALLDRVHAAGNANPGWSSIRLQRNGPILKISQSFPRGSEDLQNDALAQPLDQQDAQDSRLEACEEDSEALVRTSDTDETLQVDYDIVLSPSYQVPVLYFVLRQADELLGVDAVYRYLVLDRYRENIKSVGIMGGISFGYHPVSGTPAFFVHPCNTADAMRDIATGRGIISPETYLIVWLGLVGNCLRLHLPSNLFAEDGNLRLESNN